MGLEKEVQDISELIGKSESVKDEAGKKLQNLRKRIIDGETTGDKIKDFVIAVHSSIDKEAEKPYRQLEEMLQGKEGEQVLVVNESLESYQEGLMGGTNVESTLELGVLCSENLTLEIGELDIEMPSFFSSRKNKRENKGPRLILPTKNYASGEPYSDKWELSEGNIIIPYFDFLDFDPEGEKTMSDCFAFRSDQMPHHSSRLLIKVGREDVSDYFKSSMSLYKDDFFYVKALDLLGIKDQSPRDFLIGYESEIGETKGDIISSLKELVIQERKLVDATDYSKFRGNKELMDEVAFKLNAPTEKLRETRRNIKGRLEAAINLDMHVEPLNIDGERPGEILDVQKYITEMCKSYEVEISN